MTTTITVKANHGWAVRVTTKDPKTGDELRTDIVEANTERDFHATSHADLEIHEIQPDEAKTENSEAK